MTTASPLSNHLRARKAEIARTWETLVRAEVPRLATLDRASLVDHLPEFLEALARWIEGDTGAARAGFTALAEGHALQRLGYAIDLVDLIREYVLLRSTVLRELMAVPTSEPMRELMLRLNDGMDIAILEAVQRYNDVHPSLKSVLAPTDMGAVAREVAPGDHVEVTGDVLGIWDHDAVREIFHAVVSAAAPATIAVREAPDHESVIATVTPASQCVLSSRVRDLALIHGARFSRHGDALAIEWPRTPLSEALTRV